MTSTKSDRLRELSRRTVLAAAPALALTVRLIPAARATPDTLAAAMREALGPTPIQVGRVRLEVPTLVENGNAVPLSVSVESPMTASDRVTAIYIFSEKNPSPNVARFHLSQRSGRAHVRTTIRLADTQHVTAVARMTDGSLWSGAAEAIVTEGACVDGT